MATTVDWATKTINVPRTDMLLTQSVPTEIRQLDLNAFKQDLQALQASAKGMPFLRILNHNTGVTVGGAVLAQVIQIINGYSVTFEDGQYRVNAVGANSNLGDVVNVNQVSVSTSNSAGLQDLNSLQIASFGGQVAIDEASIFSGITFPVGTRSFPVNNLTDAHTIADNKGLNEFVYLTSGTVALTDVSHGHTFTTDNRVKISLVVNPSANVRNAIFKNLSISGTLDGSNIITDCDIGDINFFNGEIEDSELGGTITLGGGLSASISGCSQDDPAIIPIIDLGGSGQDLILANWKGGQIKLTNSSGVGTHVITGDGEMIVDSTCTAGTFEVYGDMKVVDNSLGATVIQENSSMLAAQAIWADSKALTVGKFLGLK